LGVESWMLNVPHLFPLKTTLPFGGHRQPW
jgi:hypothetical protein